MQRFIHETIHVFIRLTACPTSY